MEITKEEAVRKIKQLLQHKREWMNAASYTKE